MGATIERSSSRADNYQKVFIVYASAYKKGGYADPNEVADQIKEDGHNIITVSFISGSETEEVLKLGELASPRMNFTSKDTTLIQADPPGEIIDALCQCECLPEG